jgi:hypothetical protein
MGMLIESIMAANAAYSLIKTTINNGRELHSCGEALGVYLSHKETIEAEVKAGGKNDLEAFYELEKLNQQELELKYLMNKTRLGMWKDYCFFVKTRKNQRAKELKASKAKRKENIEALQIGGLLFGILLILIIMLGTVVLHHKGYF